MSFSGKHDPQDSRNYIHYFNCLKEQFIAHCYNVCSNYSVWKVLLHLYLCLYLLVFWKKIFFQNKCFFGRLFKTCLSITYELFKTTEPIIQLTVAVHVQR